MILWAAVFVDHERLAPQILISVFNKDIQKVKDEADVVWQQMSNLVAGNAEKALNQEAYNQQYNALTAQHMELKNKLIVLKEAKKERAYHTDQQKRFIKVLQARNDLLVTFDEPLFVAMVESICVRSEGILIFHLTNGAEKEIKIQPRV